VMTFLQLFAIAVLAGNVRSHGDHAKKEKMKDGASDAEGYVAEHMRREHHIDSFDLASFFKLHDLNNDGRWDKDEIEAVYGMHHEYSKALSPDEQVQKQRAEAVVKAVLAKIDTDKNGFIDQKEFEAAGWPGLETFKDVGADGHHYDVESEFFLHHEEVFHNTADTQVDEAYVHAEDLEHFSRHEAIELEEENKERKYKGLPEIKNIKEASPDDTDPPVAGSERPSDSPRAQKPITRETPPEKQPPSLKYKDAPAQAKEKPNWGEGEAGYKRPKNAADKLRKNMPYKYRFRRSWGDF